ncbi:hypothetical protein B9Z19DRAFT_1080175 [Tuber borchii]|uniref:Uncharacterized protein n=1 Tax=Tuber borchii TaxID=42251 RepID=A0A2T6ZX88_TUBBO|nr:hypothetical protein B9Z19DRAFT_1080175 [Tuber borchii]
MCVHRPNPGKKKNPRRASYHVQHRRNAWYLFLYGEGEEKKHAQYSTGTCSQRIRPLINDSSRQGVGIAIIAEENRKEKKRFPRIPSSRCWYD